MKTINFTKKDTVEILKAFGVKTGLKQIDNWLTTGNGDPEKNTANDYIFRVKVEPFELTLQGEKRKVEVIDFFSNNHIYLDFLLKNSLENNLSFELRLLENEMGKSFGFSENRPNTLVIDSNYFFVYENKNKTLPVEKLEINWEKFTPISNGFEFAISPQTYSLNGKNLTVDKMFWCPEFLGQSNQEHFSEKLVEWKKHQKPLILTKASWGEQSWFSGWQGGVLVVKDCDDDLTEFEQEIYDEITLRKIPGWNKLSFEQRKKFREKKNKEGLKVVKPEVEIAIKALENDNNSNTPHNNKFPTGWVIGGGILVAIMGLTALFKIRKINKKKKVSH